MTDTAPKPCPLLVLFHAIERERANGRHAVADELQQAYGAVAKLAAAARMAVNVGRATDGLASACARFTTNA